MSTLAYSVTTPDPEADTDAIGTELDPQPYEETADGS